MEQRVALVTGASSGIGECICRRLLDEGFVVVAVQRTKPKFEHPHLHAFEVDLTDHEKTEEVARKISQAFPVTCLVNNAGINRPNLIDETTMQDYDYVVDLNLRAAVVLIRHMLPHMRAARFGRIVNVTSRAAYGKARFSIYSASKAALVGLTRSLALELGRDWITVNAISPGPISTPLFHVSNPPDSPQTKKMMERMAIPRLGEPDDIANAVMFFFSPASGFVTGQVLSVCGGSSLGAAPL